MTGTDNYQTPHILVLGGINMGLITKAPRIPSPGETLRGESFYASSGGKGATQAVAASITASAREAIREAAFKVRELE